MKRSTWKRLRRADRVVTVSASASALALIKEHGLNSSKIKGTGKNGNITLSDVQKYLKAVNA